MGEWLVEWLTSVCVCHLILNNGSLMFKWLNWCQLSARPCGPRRGWMEEETCSPAMTEWSQAPSGWFHFCLCLDSLQASIPDCASVRRSRCVKDICHNMCDLLAVCHPLWSGGLQPIHCPFSKATNTNTHICWTGYKKGLRGFTDTWLCF